MVTLPLLHVASFFCSGRIPGAKASQASQGILERWKRKLRNARVRCVPCHVGHHIFKARVESGSRAPSPCLPAAGPNLLGSFFLFFLTWAFSPSTKH